MHRGLDENPAFDAVFDGRERSVNLIRRLMAQFAYRPALFYIDSVKYLYDSQGNDPEGYKGPLRAILAGSNLDAVAAVQHLTGVVIAIVIYRLLLRRGGADKPRPRFGRFTIVDRR